MSLEASIVQRLEELRRWQIEQQERLLKHQKEQRETLSREQIRMYQALGLTVQDINDDDGKSEIFQDSLEGNTELISLTNRYQDILTKNLEHSQVSTLSQQSRSRSNEQNVTDLDGISKHQNLLASQQKVITDTSQLAELETDNEVSSVVVHEYSSNIEQLNTLGSDSEHEFLNSNIDGTPIKLMTLDEDFIDNKKDDCLMNGSPLNECMTEQVKLSKMYAESMMDEVRPLPLEKLKNRTLFIDDIPVPSPKKDFHSLLEEMLKESSAAFDTNKSTSTVKNVTKRPFLKKGQGLARFRSRSSSERSSKHIRPRAMSLPSTIRTEKLKNTKPNLEKSIDRSRSVKNITGDTDRAPKKLPQIPKRAQNRLNLKNVPPPTKRRSESKSMPLARSVALMNELKQNDRLNNSDLEAKTKRELEEVRIFELLEEKAENSSFCSTSSTVVALLQQSIQSTPLKSRNVSMNNKPAVPQNKSTETNDSTEDLLLSEIVYTTKSNATIHNSCISYKQQFQNDAANQQREDTTAQCIQVVNSLVDEPSSDDNLIELPYGTDIDPNYGNDFAEVDQITSQRNKDNIEPKINHEKNNSLHVRFSEYNEYKTIGLTDTSTMSMESVESQKYYSDQRAWSDCSVATDSSDTEEYAPLGQDEQAKIIELQPASQHEYNRNLGIYTNRNYNDEFCKSLSENGTAHKRTKKMECIDQIKAPRNMVISVNSATDKNNPNSEDENETSILADTTLIEEATNTKERKEEGLIFKSELLKTRLLELESEIEIFRKENLAVSAQKEKLIEERKTLERQFKLKESHFEEYKKNVENALQEERKKLTRDKSALENRLKDAQAKAQQSKQERQEMQKLKDELDELKEEMSQKESRWNAAQARQRSQTRILQTENTKLKQEMQKLQSTRTNGTKIRASAKNTVSSNTKAIHQINKQLDSQRLAQNKRESTSEDDGDDCPIEPMMEAMSMNAPADHHKGSKTYPDGSKMIIYDHEQTESKNRNFITRKRNLYENLLKEATTGLTLLGETNKRLIQNSEQSAGASGYLQKCDDRENDKYDEANSKNSINNRDKINSDPRHNLANSHRSCNGVIDTEVFENVEKTLENCTTQGRSGKYIFSSESEHENGGSNHYENRKPTYSEDTVIVEQQGIKEVRYPDGRIEFLYPNGNIKKVSADGMMTKLIYYNGDVCESRKNGSIRYFYATAKTWHTTMLDGLEILEFPDGQVERRSTDGTLEVSFPDGSVRIVQSDGTEKWALPDGTIAETSTSGEKILILPNGQREVHTADHKRREYPDGTVKLVYPDGTQETRYAGGRIRLKDKDGNLLMDTHQE